ncbi:pyridoxamine 5'-phosphate oxidase-related protein [Kipferlia bialata]|uniref:Pyridoxamine 5'-phosphate oxidase-related protein n=1 Tax=Kipferlia bialata TaxID=797122 RepID=A0A9K3CXW2_9EUKA|nr:pyridoxamine 5'-phosphate oxidase-related protein [Kipferlia bialata]|eukprot:g6976.t1
MRRKDRCLSDEDSLRILSEGEYGVLSSVGVDGTPYGVPISYAYVPGATIGTECADCGAIYMHSALRGHKIDNLQAYDGGVPVSFCVVGKTQLLPDIFSTNYESVIVRGIARVYQTKGVSPDDKEEVGAEMTKGLRAIVAKYSPAHVESGDQAIAQKMSRVAVIKVDVTSITAKGRQPR